MACGAKEEVPLLVGSSPTDTSTTSDEDRLRLSQATESGFLEASQMLASALEQIDGIIAGSKFQASSKSERGGLISEGLDMNGNQAEEEILETSSNESGIGATAGDESPPADVGCPEMAKRLAGQLADVVGSGKKTGDLLRPDFPVIRTLVEWLVPTAPLPLPQPGPANGAKLTSPSPSMSTVSCPEYGELQDKLQRLEVDRESLSLQVSVLTEQVGAQTEKIKDLESLLEDKRQKLDSTEDMLQEELGARTNLETSKLDLMAQISNLRLKLAELDREKVDTQAKLRTAKVEIDDLRQSKGPPPQGVGDGGYPPGPMKPPIPGHPHPLPGSGGSAMDQAGEIEQLRSAVQQLMVANVEKEEEIEKLKSFVAGQVRNQSYPTEMWDDMSMMGVPRSVSAYAQMGNGNVSGEMDINQQLRRLLAEEVPSRGNYYSPNYASYFPSPPVQPSNSYTSSLSTLSPLTWSGPGTPRHLLPPSRLVSSPAGRQLAAELEELAPVYRRPHLPSTSSYYTGSLPRNISAKQTPPLSRRNRNLSSGEWNRAKPRSRAPFKGLKWLHKQLKPNKRSTSAPNLGNESDLRLRYFSETTESDDETLQSAKAYNDKFKRDKKQKSLRNLLGKLKRSNSQELKDPDLGNGEGFRRGVLTRATTAPRMGIGWTAPTPSTRHLPLKPPIDVFNSWPPEQVCDWLTELGLNMYVGDATRVLQSGRHLTVMTQHELEKDLGIKNPLHRKKLNLAIAGIESGRPEPYDRMDYHQVLSEQSRAGFRRVLNWWLDDIGLPQYRDAFAEARIDGEMLNAMTVEDLLLMKIFSALHHAALARGIQILRNLSFNLNRLQRKFSQDLLGGGPCPNVVQLWSQHCVSEWLRTIDLTEFTPNLMCAGIHGGLIVLEPCFTAESLAEVLQMPPQKTLLRRHLSTHFNQLLGNEVIVAKRDILNQPYVLQLNPALKVKPLKKGFSLSRKKSKTEVYLEPDELVCPVSPSRPPPSSGMIDLDASLSMPVSAQLLQNLNSSNV